MVRRIDVAIVLWCACVAACAATPSRVEERTIEDPVYHRARKLWVYTPVDYDSQRAAGYEFLLCFDGESYLSDLGSLQQILDRLTGEGKVRPTVAVLLDNGGGMERRQDLANRADFVIFVGETLVPWVRQNYRVTDDP